MADAPRPADVGRSAESLREFLARAPFTCVMSSGFFGFFAHTGMLLALESEGIHPAAFAGSSAGALVGSLAASGLTAGEIAEALVGLDRAAFWDPAPGAGLLRGAKFRAHLAALVRTTHIERCPRPLVLSTYDLGRRRTHVVDRGEIVAAVYASCAVPFLFQPIRLDGRWLADGGIADRSGLAGISRGTRLLHHHLASRSPWRRPGSPALRVVPRPGSATLVLDGLPRSGPFALAEGHRALRLAREHTLVALDRPLGSGIVRHDVTTSPGPGDVHALESARDEG